MTIRSLLLAGVAALGLTTAAHATTFDLGTVAAGTMPSFGITAGGLTATFSSIAGNGFATQDTTGLLSFNTALLDNNFFGTDPLTISFSTPVSQAISIPVALLNSGDFGRTVTVTTNTNSTYTFSTGDTGLPLGEPEAYVNFVPTSAISSFTITSADAFAVGNVGVPEPASLGLLGLGLAGLVAARRRRRA